MWQACPPCRDWAPLCREWAPWWQACPACLLPLTARPNRAVPKAPPAPKAPPVARAPPFAMPAPHRPSQRRPPSQLPSRNGAPIPNAPLPTFQAAYRLCVRVGGVWSDGQRLETRQCGDGRRGTGLERGAREPMRTTAASHGPRPKQRREARACPIRRRVRATEAAAAQAGPAAVAGRPSGSRSARFGLAPGSAAPVGRRSGPLLPV